MSVYKDAVIHYFDQFIVQSPEHLLAVTNTYKNLRANFYDQNIVDIVMQKYGAIDIYDALTFMQVYYALLEGNVLLAEIELGLEPGQDKDIEGNNKKLSTLWSPFRASFSPTSGRGYNDDGTFYWDTSLNVGIKRFDDKEVNKELPAGHAPLEVGYTNPETTLMHLKEQSLLARWPYNSSKIYLLYKNNFNLWQVNI